MEKVRAHAALVAAAGLTLALFVLPSTPASAHEIRQVGKYTFTVGFGSEPAYLGQENFIQFFLHDRSSGKPVTDLGPSLKVDVEVGSAKKALALEPSFDADTGLGTPGEYDAFFFPTTVGKYTFHFSGSIRGQNIDESFTSGPETFSEVEDPSSVEFPTTVPNTTELSGLVSNLAPRVDTVRSEVASMKSDLDTARLLAIIGLVIGALGLAVGGVALARRRRA